MISLQVQHSHIDPAATTPKTLEHGGRELRKETIVGKVTLRYDTALDAAEARSDLVEPVDPARDSRQICVRITDVSKFGDSPKRIQQLDEQPLFGWEPGLSIAGR